MDVDTMARKPAGRVAWLTPKQATALVEAAARHLRPLLTFLLCTGARLGEALDLDWTAVDLPHARVEFARTKSGRARYYTMPPAAVAALANLPHRDGKVFLRPLRSGAMVAYADRKRLEGGQIRTAWKGACRRAKIGGMTPHGLRHTWATWHHCLHLDLLKLRDEGGWASVAQVETYAHLAPPGLAQEIRAFLGISGAPAVQSAPKRRARR